VRVLIITSEQRTRIWKHGVFVSSGKRLDSCHCCGIKGTAQFSCHRVVLTYRNSQERDGNVKGGVFISFHSFEPENESEIGNKFIQRKVENTWRG
jgi:hypothetical protein